MKKNASCNDIESSFRISPIIWQVDAQDVQWRKCVCTKVCTRMRIVSVVRRKPIRAMYGGVGLKRCASSLWNVEMD